MRIATPLVLLLATTFAYADDSISDKAKLLDPIQVDSLTITPIASTQKAKATPDLLVLDEAMPKKLVRIHEVDGGDVNQLTLDNKADKPLFLLAGEVIIGGKQDRIIGRNTIVPAKSTQQVPVFCVEHGRWTEGKEFTTAKALAHGRLRGKASFESQQAVWDEVHTKNAKLKTESDTDTYRKIASEQSSGKIEDAAKRVDAAIAKLPDDVRGNVIGFAVSVNGEVATVDMFQSHALFTKLEGKLVRSYITEAVDVKAKKDVKPPKAPEVKTFMADADKAEKERAYSYDTKAAATISKKGKISGKASVVYKPSPAATVDDDAPAAYETYQKMH
jgi:hypothetical protein